MKPALSIPTNPEVIRSIEKHQGWLKKLGGKLKIWKERYYVLTDTHLYYYTGTDKRKLLGEFSLNCAQIESDTGEVEYNGDKSCLLLLKINGPSPLQDSHLNGQIQQHDQQQIILCAPNPRERKVWLRAIRKVLYLHHGGALFGTHLDEVFQYTKSNNEFLPRVVYETVKFIRENGLDTEGIFRKCGKQNAIQALADLYDSACPGPILIPDEHDVHLVSGLLKYYLRELPEPVIPYKYYDKLKAAGYRIADGNELPEYIDLFQNLPSPNYNLLKYLCQFLFEVSEHEKQNRMSIASLASMFAPNFLRQQEEDLNIEMSASQLINHTISEFIRVHQLLFPYPLKSPGLRKSYISQAKSSYNHRSLNTMPSCVKRAFIQTNPLLLARKSSFNNDMMLSIPNQTIEPVIYDRPMLLPIQSSTNANGSHGNNNNNGNDIDDNDNNEPNHQKGHFIPPFIITTINHMNHFDHNSILLNHVVSSHDHTSTISTNTAATADKNENNLVIRSHHRNHLRSNTPATIDMNHIFEQKETRIQLRKLHTESGEYELGSLIGESHEDLHCSDVKTDSSENTIEKDKKEEVNLLSQSQSNINIIKASQKSFNSLPVHQRNNELAMTPPKSRPEFPVQWSVNTANTENIETDQKNPDESNASFNLDVLTKVYSNSERLAQFNISTSNTNDYSNTTTKYAYSVFTENSDYNGCNNYHRDTLKKGRISNEIVDCKKRNEIIQNESLESHSPVEQIRYWRSVAAAAQASAAGQMARADKLTQELARLRWDLSISHMENNLLRQSLATVQSELDKIRQISDSTVNHVKREKSIRQTILP